MSACLEGLHPLPKNENKFVSLRLYYHYHFSSIVINYVTDDVVVKMSRTSHAHAVKKGMILTKTTQQSPKTQAMIRKDFMILKKSCSDLTKKDFSCINHTEQKMPTK